MHFHYLPKPNIIVFMLSNKFDVHIYVCIRMFKEKLFLKMLILNCIHHEVPHFTR